MKTHYSLPDLQTGYELDAERGWFSVITPEESTNLIINPSAETNTTGYAAIAGTITRQATYQRRGTWAVKCTPAVGLYDGLYFGATTASLITTTAGQWYTFSLDFRGVGGLAYRLYFADQWGNKLPNNVYEFYATGAWQRVSVSYYETQSDYRRVYMTKNGDANILPFYVDGLQVENKAYATTYFDGDSVGYIVGVKDFYWNGARHASTSYRSAQTAAGGKPMKLSDLGFTLLAILGLGSAPVQPISQPYGYLDGDYFQRVRRPARAFSLAGQIGGASLGEVRQYRAELMQKFSIDRTNTPQPLLLQYEYADVEGRPTGEVLDLPVVYTGGLEGRLDNLYGEKIGLNFTMYLPQIMANHQEGASLDYQDTIVYPGVTGYIMQRSKNGVWSAMGSGLAGIFGYVYSIVEYNGDIYIGGRFTSAGGVANTANLAKWNVARQAWESIGTVTGVGNPTVYTISFAPDGTMYVGGDFDAVGGVAADNIAKRSGTTWSALTSGADNSVYASGIGSNGYLYIGGLFSSAGGVANTVYVAYWTGAAWTAMDTGLSSQVRALVIDNANNIYTGNSQGVNRWNGTTWTNLGAVAGGGAYVASLAMGNGGEVYAGGDFTTIGGVSANYVAFWNGAAWEPMGDGISSAVDYWGLKNINGLLYIVGNKIWNGSAYIDIDAVANSRVGGGTNGALYAQTIFGTIYTSAVTTVTNSGSAPAYPRLTMTGPGRFYQIKNYITGDGVYFDSLTLLSGEVAVLDFAPGNISFSSNFRPNLLSAILPGSNLTTFRLLPGVNYISVYAYGGTSSATAADLSWKPVSDGIDQ